MKSLTLFLCAILFLMFVRCLHFSRLEPCLVEAIFIEKHYFAESYSRNQRWITIWDCQEYGVLTCDNKLLYVNHEKAKRLKIKSDYFKTEIVGFE